MVGISAVWSIHPKLLSICQRSQ